MPLIIACSVFVVVFILLMLLHSFLTAKQSVRERMARFIEIRQDGGAETTGASREMSGWRALVRQMSKYFEWAGWTRSVEHRLVQAGLPLRGSEFAVICLAVCAAGAAALFFVCGRQPVMGLIGACSGYLAVMTILRIKIQRRAKAFNSQLGDALTLAANSLRTGYSFLQSIEMISREMPSPIAVEFGRVLKEINLGLTTETAMNNLTRRVDSSDLDLVVTAVLIQRQVGGNLAEVLDNISGTIRARIKLRGEMRTLTAQGRLSGIIIGLLPVVLGIFIQIINPEYINILFTHPAGKMMLAVALVSQVIGVLFIRKIVTIDI